MNKHIASGGILVAAFVLGFVVTESFQGFRNNVLFVKKTSVPKTNSTHIFFHPETSCGPVAMSIASRFLGSDVSIAKCRNLLGLSKASMCSAEDLLRGFQDLGFSAVALQSERQVKYSDDVVLLLHVFGNHWNTVVCRNGNLFLVDPPRATTLVENGVEGWDGFAIAVSKKPESLQVFMKRNCMN
jgi:ABC-type bacteriocin/lantibiotic exporter with double-glycine peptidase domain